MSLSKWGHTALLKGFRAYFQLRLSEMCFKNKEKFMCHCKSELADFNKA